MQMKRLFSVFVAVFLVFGALALSAQTLQDAQKYLYAEQYLNAKKAFQGLVKQAPTAENYYHLGDYYLHVFEVDSVDEYIDTARMNFEKGVSIDAKYALNYVGLGAVKMFQQKKDDAKGYFSNALQMTKSKDVEVLYRVAEGYTMFDFNDPAAALEVLDIALKREPKRVDLHILKGDVYMMKNEGGLANSSYDEAIRLAPNKAKGYISSGKVLIRAKNYNGALELYNKGIAAEPDYYPAYRQLGDLYFLANRCKEGIEAYRKYIANSDANLDSRYMYAAFLYLCGDHLEAIDQLKELDKVLNKATIHRLLAYSMYETKDYDGSIANIEQFFREEKPTKVIASDYEYYGKAIMAKGGSEADTLRAIEQFKKAAAKDSVKAETLLFPLGENYYKAKKYAKAAEVLDIIPKYIKNVNSNVYLRQGLAYYFLKTPETNILADTTFGKLLSVVPNSTVANLWKARAKVRLDPESTNPLTTTATFAARPYFEKFLELVDKQTDKTKSARDIFEAQSWLAIYYVCKVKDKAKAEEAWTKALAADPNNSAAKNVDALLKASQQAKDIDGAQAAFKALMK